MEQLDSKTARERAGAISIFYKSWGEKILKEELDRQKDTMADMVWDAEEFYVVKGRIKQIKEIMSLFESESLYAIEASDE